MLKRKLPPAPEEKGPTKKDAMRLAETGRTEVSAVQCPTCFDIVYSRAHHDMRYCTCGAVAIDGGRDYSKVSFNVNQSRPLTFKLVIPFTRKELFDDWNRDRNELGVIRVQECGRIKRKKRR